MPIAIHEHKLPDDYEAIADKYIPVTPPDNIGTFCSTWTVTNWSSLSGKLISPSFHTGGIEWCLWLYPLGDDRPNHISLFLALKSIPDNEETVESHVVLCLSDPTNPYRYAEEFYVYQISSLQDNWGFPEMIHKDIVTQGDETYGPLVVNDTLVCTVIIRLSKTSPGFSNNDIVPETRISNSIKLTNQCDAGYIHSFIRSLYYMKLYQKYLFQISTENEDPSHSVPLALQRIFYHLQFSETAVSTVELTRSLGWTTDAFKQRNLDIINKLLQSILGMKMENDGTEHTVKKLFTGKIKSNVECINTDGKLEFTQSYTDIQLNIRGCSTLNDSLKEYIKEEMLTGDNRVNIGMNNLQDAKKSVVFEEFPSVLHLRLNRFEFDIDRSVTKINSYYTFPLQINLSPFLSPTADKNECYLYNLYSVLIHEGDPNSGQYYAFIKHTKADKWFKHSSDDVTSVSVNDLMKYSYGGIRKTSVAYMLVYIKQTSLDVIIDCDYMPSESTEHLKREAFKLEHTLEGTDNQHQYIAVNMSTANSFCEKNKLDICRTEEGDVEEDPFKDVVYYYKHSSLGHFKEEVAYRISLPADNIRLWAMDKRNDGTIRPEHLLSEEELQDSMEVINSRYNPSRFSLNLYIEDISNNTTEDNSTSTSDKILLFVNLFDPFHQSISCLGSLHLDKNKTFQELSNEFIKLAGFDEDTPLQLYEENVSSMVQYLDLYATPSEAGIRNGDIICIEKHIKTREEMEHLTRHNLQYTYLKYLKNQVKATFMPKRQKKVELSLMKDMPYSKIVEKLAADIKEDARHVQLVLPNNQDQSTSTAKRIEDMSLSDIMQAYATADEANEIYYEVLPTHSNSQNDIINMDIYWCFPSFNDVTKMSLSMAKDATINDVYEKLTRITGQTSVHVYGTLNNKYHSLEKADPLKNLTEGMKIYIEGSDNDDDVNRSAEDQFITVHYHSQNESGSDPIVFRFLIIKDEIFNRTKRRLINRIGLSHVSPHLFVYELVSPFQITTIRKGKFILSNHSFINDVLQITMKG